MRVKKITMDKSLLTRLIGFTATLIHGDTLVIDRWRWLKRRLPTTHEKLKLLDIGCGTGAFSIGAALRGYSALGLSWDERNNRIATERALICKAELAAFEVFDVRNLNERVDFHGKFDIAVCLENIEHIIDDKKLFGAISSCLKPGGRLFLTTPYYYYRPITAGENGPFAKIEDGSHVRRGYTKAMLEDLCKDSKLRVEEITYCSGFLSQKATYLLRTLNKIHPIISWIVVLPLRIFPLVFDDVFTRLIKFPRYSICLEAYKSEYSKQTE